MNDIIYICSNNYYTTLASLRGGCQLDESRIDDDPNTKAAEKHIYVPYVWGLLPALLKWALVTCTSNAGLAFHLQNSHSKNNNDNASAPLTPPP